MHGAAVLQIAHHGDVRAIHQLAQARELALDGVHVQGRLARVLARAVAGIDDGDVGGARKLGYRALLGVADDQRIDIADGTVYPILRKLKSDGLVTTYLSEESGGPPRKYYSLTQLGQSTFEADRAEYLEFAKTVESMLKENKDEKE